MAATTLQVGDHTVTRNGVHCSKSDCVLSTCINSKIGKIKKDTDAARAQKRKRSRRQVNTAESGMDSRVTKEQHTELFWEDIGTILDQHAFEDFRDTQTGSPYQDIAAIRDGTTTADPHGQSSAAPPCFGQRGMQLVRSQPQPWMEEQNPSFPPVVQNSSCLVQSKKTSRQFLSANQPMVTEQTDPRQYFTAVPQNSQITNAMTTPTMNIPSASDNCCGATCSRLGIGTRSLEGLPFILTEYSKGNTQTCLNSHQVYSTVGQYGNTSDISRNPRGRFHPTRRLFGILSLILQAFDGPHTAELEECYTSALQKALTEIQAAKGLCK